MSLKALISREPDHERASVTVPLRLASLALCSDSLVTAGLSLYFNGDVYTDGNGSVWSFMLMIPSFFSIPWTVTYLILIACSVIVPYPVTITLELLSWLFALSLTLLAAVASGWGYVLSNCHQRLGACEDWRKVSIVMIFSFVLLIMVMYANHSCYYLRVYC